MKATSMQAPNVSAPSIASSAMLVELSVSQWTGLKRDRTATKRVNDDANAEANVARVNKSLLGDNQYLKAIHSFIGNLRLSHYAMTMPWSDTGMRLLPTAKYMDYHATMTAAEAEFNRMVDEFLNDYDYAVMHANLKLGSLFNPDDYPTRDSLASKFAFRLSYIPLPESGDFRIDIGNQATDEVRARYDEYYQRQLHTALNDVWQRLHDALTNMAYKLDPPSEVNAAGNAKKVRYHDSLVPNFLEIVDLLRTCNITGDTQMTALHQRLESAFQGVTTDALKEDEFLRMTAKREVDAAIAQLPSLDW